MGDCGHGTIEPVYLSTGEIVNAVCVACLEAVNADAIASHVDWLDDLQHALHERMAALCQVGGEDSAVMARLDRLAAENRSKRREYAALLDALTTRYPPALQGS